MSPWPRPYPKASGGEQHKFDGIDTSCQYSTHLESKHATNPWIFTVNPPREHLTLPHPHHPG